MNDQIVNILREYNQDMHERVKERRFYQHNKEWIESMDEYEKNNMGDIDPIYMHQNPNFMNPQNVQQEDDNQLNEAQIDPRMWDDSEEEEN